MIERHIDIPTSDGAMNSFVVHPEEGGPHPVILFYMDAPGKREELHDFARRLASVGYFVVLPNLYYRRTREFTMVRDDAGRARMYEQMNALTNGLVASDTGAMLAFVDRDPAALASKVGAVGYCMSGPFVIAAAAAYPQRIRCIAAIHGARMVTDREDSPDKLVAHVRCETYVGCAEIDEHAPPEAIAALERAMKVSGTPHRIEWYKGARHGFVFPSRDIFDKPNAERHWERLFELFGRNLCDQ